MESVLVASLGVLTGHLLTELVAGVLAMEDIASADSSLAAQMLETLLAKLKELHTVFAKIYTNKMEAIIKLNFFSKLNWNIQKVFPSFKK